MKTALRFFILFLCTYYSSNVEAQCDTNDYEALRQIYIQTLGDDWSNALDWQALLWGPSPPLDCDLCSLTGITCDG